MSLVQKMQRDKETKGTHVYRAVDGDGNPQPAAEAVVTTLYVQKQAIGSEPAPERITVTIREG